MANVRPHYRKTKKGNTVVKRHNRRTKKKVTRRRAQAQDISPQLRKKVLQDYSNQVKSDLRQKKMAKLLDLGTIRVKIKPAKKGGKKMYMPMLGRTIVTKPKPRQKQYKFRAGQALK